MKYWKKRIKPAEILRTTTHQKKHPGLLNTRISRMEKGTSFIEIPVKLSAPEEKSILQILEALR